MVRAMNFSCERSEGYLSRCPKSESPAEATSQIRLSFARDACSVVQVLKSPWEFLDFPPKIHANWIFFGGLGTEILLKLAGKCAFPIYFDTNWRFPSKVCSRNPGKSWNLKPEVSWNFLRNYEKCPQFFIPGLMDKLFFHLPAELHKLASL